MLFSLCNRYGFKYGIDENIILFKSKILTLALLFFKIFKRVELESWDWSYFKEQAQRAIGAY